MRVGINTGSVSDSEHYLHLRSGFLMIHSVDPLTLRHVDGSPE